MLVRPLLSALHLEQLLLVAPDNSVVRVLLPDGVRAPAQLPASLMETIRPSVQPDGVVFGDVMPGMDGESTIHISLPVGNGYLAVGALKTDYIVSMQRLIAFGKGGHAAIVDRTGRVLAHPNAKWTRNMKDISVVRAVQKMMAGGTGVAFFYSPAVKLDMVAGYTSVKAVGWGVMVPQPMEELRERAREVAGVALGLAAAGIVVAGLLSWWVAGLLSRPVLTIASAARRVAGGNMESVPSPRGFTPREIASLGESFSAMVQAIGTSHRALHQSEKWFRDFAESSADWFWEMGPDFRFTYHSQRYF